MVVLVFVWSCVGCVFVNDFVCLCVVCLCVCVCLFVILFVCVLCGCV